MVLTAQRCSGRGRHDYLLKDRPNFTYFALSGPKNFVNIFIIDVQKDICTEVYLANERTTFYQYWKMVGSSMREESILCQRSIALFRLFSLRIQISEFGEYYTNSTTIEFIFKYPIKYFCRLPVGFLFMLFQKFITNSRICGSFFWTSMTKNILHEEGAMGVNMSRAFTSLALGSCNHSHPHLCYVM